MGLLLSVVPWWGRALMIVALVVALFGFGWIKGDEHGTGKLTTYIGAQAVQSQKLLAARERVIYDVEVKWKTRTETIIQQGATIEKEVIRYVTKDDDAGCVVPVGFVRLYNAAVANNANTGPPVDADRAPSGVPLSTVAETDAFNLTLGHRWKARALECVEIYDRVRAAQP